MARKSARRYKSSASMSPLHPALHYIVFLVLALILVLFVGVIMQKTAKDTRARLVCPQYGQDPVKLVEELSRRCPDIVEYTKDDNGCGVWVCKADQTPPKDTLKPARPPRS